LGELATTVYGSIEILVNNAGIYPPGGTLVIDGDTFDRIMAVNVKAPYFLTAALVPAMAANGRGVVLKSISLDPSVPALRSRLTSSDSFWRGCILCSSHSTSCKLTGRYLMPVSI
jgi:NAD(P)-dependent dehydrogenase (short-subunit alcohol dehydrogenase family)